MTLKEINKNYNSDKGVTHNYLNFYEDIFKFKKEQHINLLEIGVLFGNSLKLWHDYFIKGTIYGIDDFSQQDGQHYYDFEIVDSKKIADSLSEFKRINLIVANCEDEIKINNLLMDLQFDFIIDDGSHDLNQQMNNYKIYNKFLKNDGLYICEDVQTDITGHQIINFIEQVTPNKNIELHEFDIINRKDDRVILVK